MLFQSIPSIRFAFLSAMIAVVLISSSIVAHGQDDTLSAVQAKWADINKKLDEKQALLESGDTTPGLAQEYSNLVEEAQDMIGRLRVAAIAQLGAEPESKETLRLLMGIMIHDASENNDAAVFSAGDAMIKAKASKKYFAYGATTDKLGIDERRIFEELLIRHREAVADDLPRIELETSKGTIVVELFENEAPNTVANFISLVESGFYADKLFHRVIEGKLAQTGGHETFGIGTGGPGYAIECECKTPEARPHFTGSISMAPLNGTDSGGSQFFVTFERISTLDGIHTVFGRVISGSDVLPKLEFTTMMINGQSQDIPEVNYDKIVSAKVLRKREHEYKPKKVGDPEPEPTPPTNPDLSKQESDAEDSEDSEMKEEDSSEKESEDKEADSTKEEKESTDEPVGESEPTNDGEPTEEATAGGSETEESGEGGAAEGETEEGGEGEEGGLRS